MEQEMKGTGVERGQKRPTGRPRGRPRRDAMNIKLEQSGTQYSASSESLNTKAFKGKGRCRN